MEEQSQQEHNIPQTQQLLNKKERRELRREEQKSATASLHKARSLRRAVLWIIVIAAIGGAVAGATYLARTSPNDSSNDSNTALASNLSSSDWVRGNPSSKVTLIEYGDFQCPACAQYHPLVKALKDEFGEQVAFGFRHFPLSQSHPNARSAARAAEAAGAQGKFWEMHDLLFERQTEWAPKPSPQGTFISYANELGLNIDQFETDMDRDDIDDKITSHYQAGIASKVNATPTFFLNGAKLENQKSYDDFRRLLSQAVEIANQTANTPSAQTPITQPNESDINAAKANP